MRGSEWARKLKREQGLDIAVEHVRTVEGKAAAKKLEIRYIDIYEKLYRNRPGYVDDTGQFVPIQKSRH